MRLNARNPRSRDIIAMEAELRDLLTHSSLTDNQRKEFLKVLESVFDLFLTPVTISNSNAEIALVDVQSVNLFGKMQGLISALTVLILDEDERSNITFNQSYLPSPEQRVELLQRFLPSPDRQSSDYQKSRRESQLSHVSQRYEYQHQESMSHSSFENRRSLTSPFLKTSPSFTSNLPQFRDHKRQSIDFRPDNNVDIRGPRDFKVVNTPVPRNFSRSISAYESMESPSTPVSMGHSGTSADGSGSKRYSMRF